MAVTDETFDPAALDGHTMAELIEYLDADRTPRDESIESSPGCRLALAALERLQDAARSYLDDAPVPASAADDLLPGILARLDVEVRAGRRIPLPGPPPGADLRITEGAVRGIVRAAGDEVEGVLVGRVLLDGDLDVAEAPVRITVEVGVAHGLRIPEVTDRLRAGVRSSLGRHTALVPVAIDIQVLELLDPPAGRPA